MKQPMELQAIVEERVGFAVASTELRQDVISEWLKAGRQGGHDDLDVKIDEAYKAVIATTLREVIEKRADQEWVKPELWSDAYMLIESDCSLLFSKATSREHLRSLVDTYVSKASKGIRNHQLTIEKKSAVFNDAIGGKGLASPTSNGSTAPEPEDECEPSLLKKTRLELIAPILDTVHRTAADRGGAWPNYISWWIARNYDGLKLDVIASRDSVTVQAVKNGIFRADDLVNKVAFQETSQVAPAHRECGSAITEVKQLYKQNRPADAKLKLDAMAASHSEDPDYWGLKGRFAADAGDFDLAITHLERGLVFADDPDARARLWNNIGECHSMKSIIDPDASQESQAVARRMWMRATTVQPSAPTPILNLLADACMNHDEIAVRYYLLQIKGLLGSKDLRREERKYVLLRLDENPKFNWARDRSLWSRGPEKWLAKERTRNAESRTSSAKRLLVLILALLGSVSLACMREPSSDSGLFADWMLRAPESTVRTSPAPRSPCSASELFADWMLRAPESTVRSTPGPRSPNAGLICDSIKT